MPTSISKKEKIRSIKIICIFLALTAVLSTILYLLVIMAGSLSVAEKKYAYLLMWCPGISALITYWLYNIKPSKLGFSWPGWKYMLLGYAIPALYCLGAYVPVWLTGLGTINTNFLTTMATQLGGFWPQIPQPLFALFYTIITMAIFPRSCAVALGEEIGWRGLLTPQLLKLTSFGTASFITGLIWAIWHYPLIIFSDYNMGTPVWYALICFTIMAIGVSFIMTWLRVKSNSVWPCALLHASHNLFIMDIFNRITSDTGYTKYFIGEFGIALTLPITLIAIYCWFTGPKQ